MGKTSTRKKLVRPLRGGQGSSIWAKKLYELFAPVREDLAKHRSKQIDAEIEEALAEVRSRRGGP